MTMQPTYDVLLRSAMKWPLLGLCLAVGILGSAACCPQAVAATSDSRVLALTLGVLDGLAEACLSETAAAR